MSRRTQFVSALVIAMLALAALLAAGTRLHGTAGDAGLRTAVQRTVPHARQQCQDTDTFDAALLATAFVLPIPAPDGAGLRPRSAQVLPERLTEFSLHNRPPPLIL